MHRVYALEAAREKGNALVEFELADLKDKVAAQERQARERMGALAVTSVEPRSFEQDGKRDKARAKQTASLSAKPMQLRRASIARVAVKARQAAGPAVAQARVPVARGFVRPVMVMRRGYVPATGHVRVTEARGLFR
jgi:hypothetical protein